MRYICVLPVRVQPPPAILYTKNYDFQVDDETKRVPYVGGKLLYTWDKWTRSISKLLRRFYESSRISEYL